MFVATTRVACCSVKYSSQKLKITSTALEETRSGVCSSQNARMVTLLCLVFLLISLAVYLPGDILQLNLFKIHVYMGNTTDKPLAASMKPVSHIKCRSEFYPRGDKVRRFPIPDDKVHWDVPFPEYKPLPYTSDSVASKPVWADPDFIENKDHPPPKWNALDGKVDRRSHMGNYSIVDHVPRNPVGRTGICHRGTLGRWGPNHAADPIVTRWKCDEKGNKILHSASKKPILQFVAVLRRDSGIWAIPGGMVDPGEKVSVTLKREFGEEALNSLEASADEKAKIEAKISDLFNKGEEVYRGYVDDPRNTDNSWMETIAFNFHDETGHSVGQFRLHAGDDAVGVNWTDIEKNLNLFASHTDFVERVAKKHNAHW